MKTRRIKKDKEILNKPDMRIKLNEMEAFCEYAQNSWAYYYAYPEYFVAEKFPPNAGENSTLGQGNGKHVFSVDHTGQFCIYFCPAVAFLNRQELLNPLFSILKGSSFMNQWMIPPEENLAWIQGPRIKNIRNSRITGGYLKVSTITNVKSGSLRHAQIQRSADAIPALNLAYATFATHNEPSQTFMVRYRHSKNHPKFSDDNNYVVYHLIHGTGFIPNTLIEVECDIGYETACINTMCRNDQSHISVVPQPSEARDKARKLLDNMPLELFTQPLTNPLKYRKLFDGDVSADKCFVEKNVSSLFEGINIYNNLVVAQNTGGFSNFLPGQGPQPPWNPPDVGNPPPSGGPGNPPSGGNGSRGNNLYPSGEQKRQEKTSDFGIRNENVGMSEQSRQGDRRTNEVRETQMKSDQWQGNVDNLNVLYVEHQSCNPKNNAPSNPPTHNYAENQPVRTTHVITNQENKKSDNRFNKENVADIEIGRTRATSVPVTGITHETIIENISDNVHILDQGLTNYLPLIEKYVTEYITANPSVNDLNEEEFVNTISSNYMNTQFPDTVDHLRETLMMYVQKIVRNFYTI